MIWATGFGVDHSWIDVPVFDEDGRVVHQRGATDSPGLYFLGLTWQHTRGSALLGWVKDDAEYLAHRVSAFRDGAPAKPPTHGDQPSTTGEQHELNPRPVPD